MVACGRTKDQVELTKRARSYLNTESLRSETSACKKRFTFWTKQNETFARLYLGIYQMNTRINCCPPPPSYLKNWLRFSFFYFFLSMLNVTGTTELLTNWWRVRTHARFTYFHIITKYYQNKQNYHWTNKRHFVHGILYWLNVFLNHSCLVFLSFKNCQLWSVVIDFPCMFLAMFFHAHYHIRYSHILLPAVPFDYARFVPFLAFCVDHQLFGLCVPYFSFLSCCHCRQIFLRT